MLANCPICGKDGSLQQRYNSVRVGHYKGWKGKTRIIEWHSTNIQDVLMVNKTRIGLDEHGKLYLFTKPLGEDHEKDHCLPKPQIMSPASFTETCVWRPGQARLPRRVVLG